MSPDSEGEESEEESEVLEESPCGRWRKMRAEVSINTRWYWGIMKQRSGSGSARIGNYLVSWIRTRKK